MADDDHDNGIGEKEHKTTHQGGGYSVVQNLNHATSLAEGLFRQATSPGTGFADEMRNMTPKGHNVHNVRVGATHLLRDDILAQKVNIQETDKPDTATPLFKSDVDVESLIEPAAAIKIVKPYFEQAAAQAAKDGPPKRQSHWTNPRFTGPGTSGPTV